MEILWLSIYSIGLGGGLGTLVRLRSNRERARSTCHRVAWRHANVTRVPMVFDSTGRCSFYQARFQQFECRRWFSTSNHVRRPSIEHGMGQILNRLKRNCQACKKYFSNAFA